MFTRNLDCYREATQTICAWLVDSSCDNLIVPVEKLRPREGRESQYRDPSGWSPCPELPDHGLAAPPGKLGAALVAQW